MKDTVCQDNIVISNCGNKVIKDVCTRQERTMHVSIYSKQFPTTANLMMIIKYKACFERMKPIAWICGMQCLGRTSHPSSQRGTW